MPGSETSLIRRLVRALVAPVLVLLLVAGYFVTANALAVNTVTDELADANQAPTPWKASYSRQFPGCVAAVLWPERETPVAVVVRWRSGRVERIDRIEAARRAVTSTRRDDGEIIGACYRR